MEARRSTLGAAVLNDLLYSVGGFDGTTGLNTCEVVTRFVESRIIDSRGQKFAKTFE